MREHVKITADQDVQACGIGDCLLDQPRHERRIDHLLLVLALAKALDDPPAQRDIENPFFREARGDGIVGNTPTRLCAATDVFDLSPLGVRLGGDLEDRRLKVQASSCHPLASV